MRRMLADPRAQALVDNFAGQWLLLRQLDERVARRPRSSTATCDASFKRETELLFETILREDRSVVDLIDADYTFVDERLARHYGIPNIRGSRFRRVALDDDARRGLLGQGSILTVTSAGNRTSPVKRGKWILENLLGAPVPQPPPGVETNLEEGRRPARADPVAAPAARAAPGQPELRVVPCGHGPDRLRARELRPDRHSGGTPTAARRSTPRASSSTARALDGPASLRQALLDRRDAFVADRHREAADLRAGPTRRVLRHAGRARPSSATPRRDDYRFSSLVLGIVKSVPFQMKTKAPTDGSRHRASRAEERMFITKKHLSRRTFLRGAGVTLALPLLESMVPAATALGADRGHAEGAGSAASTSRTARRWTSGRRPGEGTAFEFSEILQPLEPFRDRVCVVSDLAHGAVAPWTGEDTGGAENHVRAAAVFLSGAHPVKKNEAHVGVTVDQIAAQHIGQDTPLPSIELSIEPLNLTCGDAGFTCAYRNTLSWKSATLPLPMENNPQVVFERLFGDGSTDAQRQERRQQSRSLLDSITRAGAVAARRICRPAIAAVCATTSTTCARSSGASSRWMRQLSHEPRSARCAGRHPGRLRGASEADVRSAGARLSSPRSRASRR